MFNHVLIDKRKSPWNLRNISRLFRSFNQKMTNRYQLKADVCFPESKCNSIHGYCYIVYNGILSTTAFYRSLNSIL